MFLKKNTQKNKLIWGKKLSSANFTLFVVSEKVVKAVMMAKCWKQDILLSECTELITGLKRGRETLSYLIFFGCHFVVELLFFLVTDGFYFLSWSDDSNPVYLTIMAPRADNGSLWMRKMAMRKNLRSDPTAFQADMKTPPTSRRLWILMGKRPIEKRAGTQGTALFVLCLSPELPNHTYAISASPSKGSQKKKCCLKVLRGQSSYY